MILKDKTIIVTGVGPGMGVKLAREVASAGGNVVLAARSKDFIDQAADEINSSGGSAMAQSTDVSDEAQCNRLADVARECFGRIDGLINSAYRPGNMDRLEALDYDDLLQSIQVTVLGTLKMSRAVLPIMKKQGNGAIVNICSQVARKHLVGQGGYAMTKAAVSCLSRQMALEFAPYGIRVNTTHHGWMWGQPVEEFLTAQAEATGTPLSELRAGIATAIPLGDVPEDDVCARAAIMLLSDYADAVNGASLDVNGGEYMAL